MKDKPINLNNYTRGELCDLLTNTCDKDLAKDIRWELIYRRDKLLSQIKGNPDIQV